MTVKTSLLEKPARVAGEVRRLEECGVSAHERALVGLKNDRARNGPRFCLRHHPDSMAGSGGLL